jgi:UDP-galactopyranose mutase
MFDYPMAGGGFAGAVLAGRLARQFNKKVLIVDRRTHIGGKCI